MSTNWKKQQHFPYNSFVRDILGGDIFKVRTTFPETIICRHANGKLYKLLYKHIERCKTSIVTNDSQYDNAIEQLLNQNGGLRGVSPTSTTTNSTLSYPPDR